MDAAGRKYNADRTGQRSDGDVPNWACCQAKTAEGSIQQPSPMMVMPHRAQAAHRTQMDEEMELQQWLVKSGCVQARPHKRMLGHIPETERGLVCLSTGEESACKLRKIPTRVPEFRHCRSCVDAGERKLSCSVVKSSPPTARTHRSARLQDAAWSGGRKVSTQPQALGSLAEDVPARKRSVAVYL